MNRGRIFVAQLLLVFTAVGASRAAAAADFSGTWKTTFGPMTLRQTGEKVSGHYVMQEVRCTLEGKVQDRRLTFTYHEPQARGTGTFDLSKDGNSFMGRWQETGGAAGGRWVGRRQAQTAAKPRSFDGLWQTTFGRMRLVVARTEVGGCYSYAGGSTIEGLLKENRLTFRYRETDANGEGWFELSDNGQSFHGKWKPAGSNQWQDWSGDRVAAVAGRTWLVVLEARWESSLADREYAFGNMLRAFFNRVPHVQIRHRFFSNEQGLRRWCGELAYLAEPVVLVFASYGTDDGLTVGGKKIGTDALADALNYAGNVELMHFSACQIMKGNAATALQQKLKRPCPISGYKTSVDWAASAVIEFIYLDMILARRMTPADAAQQVLKLAPFAGDKQIPGAVLRPAGFRLLLPKVADVPTAARAPKPESQ